MSSRAMEVGLSHARCSFVAIRDFLHHLRRHGYLTVNGDLRHILSVTVIADLNTPPRPENPARVNGVIPMPPPAPARKTLAHELRDHRQHAAWENSNDRAVLLRAYGELPGILAATSPDETTPDIRVTPVHWHTHLYLLFVHQSPGATFTLREATHNLVADGLAYGHRDVLHEVHAFFLRLEEHGCLASNSAWAIANTTYTVIHPTL